MRKKGTVFSEVSAWFGDMMFCTVYSGGGRLTRLTSPTAGAISRKAPKSHFSPPLARTVPGHVVLCKLLLAEVL